MLLGMAFGTASARPPCVGRTDSLMMAPTAENPRTSEGDFLIRRDGTILTVYTRFQGAEDHDEAVLAGRTSPDGGRSWSEPYTLIEKEGAQNVMSASLLRLQNDSVALFYAVKNSAQDLYAVMRLSGDEGRSWGERREVIPAGSGYFVLNNCRVIQLRSGRLLAPVSRHDWGAEGFDMKGRIFCYYSDDNGRSWHVGEQIRAENPAPILQEPGVVELSDGRVLMYIRTDAGRQYFCRSADGGSTWSPASPGSLVSSLAPALIVRDPYRGGLVAVWNNHPSERNPLSLAVSRDEGESWEPEVTLENSPGTWYCYPALRFPDEGSVLVSYCLAPKANWGLGGMKILRLDADSLSLAR